MVPGQSLCNWQQVQLSSHASLIVPRPALSCQLQPAPASQNQRKGRSERSCRGREAVSKQLCWARRAMMVSAGGRSATFTIFVTKVAAKRWGNAKRTWYNTKKSRCLRYISVGQELETNSGSIQVSPASFLFQIIENKIQLASTQKPMPTSYNISYCFEGCECSLNVMRP